MLLDTVVPSANIRFFGRLSAGNKKMPGKVKKALVSLYCEYSV